MNIKKMFFFFPVNFFLFINLFSCSLKYQRETISEINVPQISFKDVTFTQYSKNKKEMQLDADAFEQYKGSSEVYSKNAKIIIFDDEQNQKSEAYSVYLSGDSKNHIFEFFDGIEFSDFEQNINIKGDTLKWNGKTEQLVSAKNKELTIKKDDFEVTGTDFSASAVSNTFLFSGKVHGKQILASSKEGEQSEEVTFSGDSMKGSVNSSKESKKENYTLLSGNAFVKTSTMEIYADSIELSGEDFNYIKANGNIKGTNTESELSFSGQQLEYNQDTKVVVLSGDVELVDIQNEVTAKAQIIEYDQNTDIAVMQIDVELTQKQNVCSAAYSIYRKNEQTLELSGNATVKQQTDIFRAQSIKFNMETEDIIMDGNVRGSVTTKNESSNDSENAQTNPSENQDENDEAQNTDDEQTKKSEVE